MTINIKALENVKARSAWMKGVKAYAVVMMEGIENADAIHSKEELKKAILNGAFNWKNYSYGGCALVYNRDIAERLCTPSEFRKVCGGLYNPNKYENWLDVQARALEQAYYMISELCV